MANRYWVGGSGTWNTTSTTNWSASPGGAGGASRPTAADSVFFDQAGTYTVTMTGALNCLDFTVSAGTVTFINGTTPTLAVAGNWSTIDGPSWGNCPITFTATTSKTIDTNSLQLNTSVTFNGAGGTWTLQSLLQVAGATSTVTLTAGTLDLNDNGIQTTAFSSSNSNTRSIAFGTSGYIQTISGTAAATVWNMATVTGFSYTGTSFVRIITQATGDAKTINTGAVTEAQALNFTLYAYNNVASTYIFTAGNRVRNLTVQSVTGSTATISNIAITIYGNFNHTSSGGTVVFTAGANAWTFGATSGSYTITPASGFTYNFPWIFGTATSTAAWTLAANLTLGSTQTATLTGGTLDLNNFTLTTGIFSSSNTNARSIAFGTGNIALTHTTAATTVLVMANATNFTCTGTGGFTSAMSATRTFTFGTTGGTATNAPNLLLTSGASIPTLTTSSKFNNLDFGTTAFTLAATSLFLNSLRLSSSGTFTNLTVTMFGTGTLTPNGKPIAALTVNHNDTPSGTTTLAGALSCTTYTQTAGTLDFATFNLTCSGAAAYTNGTLSNIGTIFCTTWTCNGTFTLTQGTITPSTSFVVAAAGGFNYTGGNLSSVTNFTHTNGVVNLNNNLTLAATGTYTFTAGTLILNEFDLTVGRFSSSGTGTRSIEFGANNIILATTTAAQINLAMADTTGFTWTGTGGFVAAADITRTFQFGSTTAGGREPNLTFAGSGTAVQTITTSSWFRTIDFGATAFALPTTSVNLNSLTLSTGGTFTGLSATMFREGTITPNGKPIAALTINVTVSPNPTTTLAGALACTTYTQTAGTLDFATFDLTCSGVATYNAGTLSNIGTIFCTTWTCNGTFTLTQGTITPSVSFVVAGGFNYTGGTLSAVPAFTQNTGTVSFGQSYALTATGTYTFTAGVLSLDDNINLTTGVFSSSNTNVRSIAFGTGNIVLAHTTAATTVLAIVDATNFNWTGTTGGFRSDAAVTRTFVFGTTGGTFYNAPNLAITSGAAIPTITTNSWLKVLDFTGSTCAPAASTFNVDTLTLDTGGTYTNLIPQFTRTQTWTAQFGKQLGGIGINRLFTTLTLDGTQTFTATSICTLVTGTLDLGGYDLTVGLFSSSGTAPRTVVFGNNNMVLNHSTAAQTVLSVANATNFSYTSTGGGFVSDAAVTRTFVFGTTGSISNAPDLLISSGTAIPTITTGSWFNRLDFTGSACTPAATVLNVSSLVLSTGGTFTGLSATMRSSGTIVPNGKTIAALIVNHTDPGTTTLAGALICTTQSYIIGNVDFGGFNLTGTAATYNGGIFSNLNVLVCTTFTIAGNFELITGTITPSTSFVLTSGSFTYTGGTLSPVGTFTHTAGTVVLNKDYSLTATGTYTLTAGSLNLNNNNLTVGIFSSTGTGARSIAFGTGNIVLAHTTAATTVLSMANATNFTWTGTGGFVSDASVTRTYAFGATGGTTSNAPNLSITSGSSVQTFGTGYFNTLDFTGTTCTVTNTTAGTRVSTLILAVGGTYTSFAPTFTRSQTWSMQHGKELQGFGISDSATITLNGTQTFPSTSFVRLVNGSLNLGGYDLTIGQFLGDPGPTSISFGSNNIILVQPTAAANRIDIPNATNFTWTGTGGFLSAATVTATFIFGTTGGSATNGPNLTFTGSGTAVQTITTGGWFNRLDFGTTAFNPGTTSLNLNSLTLSASGTYTGLTATMVGDGIITPNGRTISALNINITLGTTNTTELAGALTSTGRTTLTNGTLKLNNFTLTSSAFDSNGSNTRSVMFGSGNIALAATIVLTVLDLGTATNFSWTGTGGFTSVMSLDRTFRFGTTGGNASNAPNLSLTSGAGVPTLPTGSWFKNLNFTGSTGTVPATSVRVDTLTLATGGTYTGLTPIFTRTQTWTSQFSKQLAGIGCDIIDGTLTLDDTQTYAATSQVQLFNGVLDLGGSDLTVGTFSSSNTNIRAVAFGANNIVLATATAAALNLDMVNATNFSWTGTGGFAAAANITRTFTFGTTGGTATNAPRLALTGSGTAIPTLTTGSWFDVLDFGTTAFVLAATTLNLGSLTLSTGGTFTNLTAVMRGTGTITPNGKTVATLTVNHTGTTTLAGALATAATATTTLTSGTLNLDSFTLTTGIFSSSNTNTRSIAFGTGNIVLAHTTLGTIVLAMATITNFTCTGTGGFTSAMSVTRSFACGNTAGGTSATAPNLSLTSGSAAPLLTSGSWFNTLNFTGTTSTPTGTTILNVNSLILATGGTYTGLTVNMVGNGAITSNGKTIAALTVNSNNPLALVSYKVYTFTSTGSITFSSAEAPPIVEYLVVAGGGGGGGGVNSGTGGGGGGAGGLILSSAQMLSGTSYPVVVGAGGGGVNLSSGTKGTNSSFNGSVAIGGGYGAQRAAGGSGGSGGGGGGENGGGAIIAGGTGTPGQGNGGGSSASAGSSGGGGGAGAAALPAVGSVASSGGIGLSLTISGAATYYAGGGGGGASAGGTAGAAGLGGGGAGKVGVIGDADAGEPGTANTGGGGGGGGGNLSGGSIGGAGGSGIVIIRYLASYADPLSTTGSPIVSTIMDSSPVASPATDDVVTLNDALTTSGITTLTLGNLNLNNFTLTTGGISSSNTNVRAIAFGSGSIALTGTAALAMADATNFTYTGTGNLTAAMSAVRTFTFGTTAGGSTSNALNLSLTSGASVPTLTSGSWFKALNFTGTTSIPAATTVYVDTLTLATGGTYTGLTPIFTRTQTWTSQFSKVLDGIGFNLAGGTLTLNNTQTYSATGSCNLVAGTLDLGGANLTVGRFISNNSNTRAISFGANNIVLATTVANTLNLDIIDATGFSWTGTGGFTAAANITRRYSVGASLAPTGAAEYTTPGTYSWTAPAGVTSVSVVAVGAGGGGSRTSTGGASGGGGGGLGWKNNITVVPGQSYTVTVGASGNAHPTNNGDGSTGGQSFFINAATVAGLGGSGGRLAGGGLGGSFVGDGGGAGGNPAGVGRIWGGGGGAGGYTGAGGNGGNAIDVAGSNGAGGGGGGAGGAASSVNNGKQGGGVGIYGQGANGLGSAAGSPGGAGSGGSGATFGGGGNAAFSTLTTSTTGGGGAVRIIWGPGRAFPSTATAAANDIAGSGVGAATAANAPNLTLTGTGTAVQTFFAGSWFNNLNFGTTAFAVPATTVSVNTLTLSSTGTYTSFVPVFTSTQTWTPQHSKQLGGIGVNGAGVTVTLSATQTYNPLLSKLIVNAGTVNLAGNSIDFYDFESTGSGTRAITGAGTLNIYNNWTVFVGADFDAAGTTINMASNNFFKTFAGGGATYGTLVQKSAAPLTVTGSNTFESIQVSDTMSPITPPAAIDFLMVAGGGGHQVGGDANAGHGGAGAGGLLYRTLYTIPTSVLTGSKTITVTVGAGGAAANGTNSTIATTDNTITFTTIGGGRGGVYTGNGIAGGSGGGGGGRDYPPGDGGAAQQPASASGGAGFAGGRCRTLNDGGGSAAGGGGGGAGAVGANGVSQLGGVGGAGLAIPIINATTATAVGVGQVIAADVWFAGGGGGQANGTGGAGGAGGGAPGASSVFQGTGVIGNTQSNATGVRNGRANTGGGAGGASTGFAGYGGTGGSGVVVIRHVRIAGYEAATTGCTVEYEGADVLYIFKSSGTITF
jgi:mucin-19